MEIIAEDARKIVDRVGAKLGHDFTYSPVYPEKRRDVCAVRHSSQDGFGYGFDTIYLVWRDTGGNINFAIIAGTENPKDYSHIAEIKDENGDIMVRINSGAGGVGLSTLFRKKKIDIGLA